MSENFENPAWPEEGSGWRVFDLNGMDYGEYYWSNRCARSGRQGTRSAWAVGGGAHGINLSCGSSYPDYLDSWMIYGPVDLSQVMAAELDFYFWLNSECDGDNCANAADPLWVIAYIDDEHWFGNWWAGNWFQRPEADPNGWVAGSLDLNQYAGQPRVWLMFNFTSDASVNYPGGAYVDDVILWGYTGATATPTPTRTRTPTPTPTRTPTLTPTPTRTPGTGRIYGRVTANLSPAAGVVLDLRHWDGSSWSTALTTTTGADGTYNFVGAPSLTVDQVYYVRYRNREGTKDRLWGWFGPDITSYAAGTNVAGGDFDIADVPLDDPKTTAPQALPVTFHWTMRNVASDRYEFELLDGETYDVLWRSGDLGRVNSFTLPSLPPGIASGAEYGWDVRINGPAGSFGLSYGTNRVVFATGPVPPTATPTVTPTPRPGTITRHIRLPLVLRDHQALCGGDFERAALGPCWTSGGELPVSLVTQLSNGEPARGQRTLLLGNPALGPVLGDSPALPPGSAWVEQEVSVPNAGTPRLTFWYRVFTHDRSCVGGGEGRTCQKPSDNLVVSINGQPVLRLGYEGSWSAPPALQDLGWRTSAVDLASWRGQTVRLRFAVWNDEFNYGQQSKGSYNTWGYVDDVVVNP